jgi:hypothetical protein
MQQPPPPLPSTSWTAPTCYSVTESCERWVESMVAIIASRKSPVPRHQLIVAGRKDRASHIHPSSVNMRFRGPYRRDTVQRRKPA